MAESDLKVILKAKDLAEHTLRVTSNCNRYPKKYRFSLVDKMQNKALEIYEYLYEANRTDLKYYRRAYTNIKEISLWVLHDKFGFGIKRLNRVNEQVRSCVLKKRSGWN